MDGDGQVRPKAVLRPNGHQLSNSILQRKYTGDRRISLIGLTRSSADWS
jgi:hypothetical protein